MPTAVKIGVNPAVVEIDQLGRVRNCWSSRPASPNSGTSAARSETCVILGRGLLEHEGFEECEEGLISTGS